MAPSKDYLTRSNSSFSRWKSKKEKSSKTFQYSAHFENRKENGVSKKRGGESFLAPSARSFQLIRGSPSKIETNCPTCACTITSTSRQHLGNPHMAFHPFGSSHSYPENSYHVHDLMDVDQEREDTAMSMDAVGFRCGHEHVQTDVMDVDHCSENNMKKASTRSNGSTNSTTTTWGYKRLWNRYLRPQAKRTRRRTVDRLKTILEHVEY